jgi:hypothetical protein
MGKYRVRPEIVDAEIYKEGMEDEFVYDLGGYGIFSKKECEDLGFSLDFKKDKIPSVIVNGLRIIVNPGDYIVKDSVGNKFPLRPEEFNKIYEKIDEEELKTYSILFHNCFTDQYQVYRVRATNKFRAGRAFYRKHDRKSFHDCIEHINEI